MLWNKVMLNVSISTSFKKKIKYGLLTSFDKPEDFQTESNSLTEGKQSYLIIYGMKNTKYSSKHQENL